MKIEIGKCSECVKEGNNNQVPIVNKKHMLCPKHNRIRLDTERGEHRKTPVGLKKRRYSEKFEYCTKWGFTKEMDMFLHIWSSGPNVSTISGIPVYFHPANFAHILAKGLNKYPHYRFNPENVMLMTQEEHHLIDNGTSEQREKYVKENPSASFVIFYKTQERLKAEYFKEFG